MSEGIAVLLPPNLAHVAVEALLVGDVPLGVRGAVSRIVVQTTAFVPEQTDGVVAFLGPDLGWGGEREVLSDVMDDPAAFRLRMGPRQVIVAACHGESALRAEGALLMSLGRRVLDALDLVDASLTGGVVVMETCYTGRCMGFARAIR